jgi:GTPase SAR1 family protein
MSGEAAIDAYRRASRYGTTKVYRTRLMLVGQERVGKTSLIKTLTDER